MTENLAFSDFLSLVDERSAALRAAVADATDLDARVPSCPDWSLRDLVAHVGEVHRFWATAVREGSADRPPTEDAVGDTAPRGDLLDWSAASTTLLLTALRTAGPEQACWTWWGASAVPLTTGAVARHQVQEAAIHAYDAQQAVGRPEPVPTAVALDGVAAFLAVSHGTAGQWPHPPARVDLRAAEGSRWSVELSPSDSAVAHGGEKAQSVALHGTASDLLLALNRREPLDRLRVEGDRAAAERLLAWPNLD